MDKDAAAFRTISEVADELEVPKHVLRFWEIRFPQIKPMKRGGGRRYYRPADMELLRGIRHLLHNEGYTIKGVQKILREHGVEAVKSSTEAKVGGVKPAPTKAAAPTAAKVKAGGGTTTTAKAKSRQTKPDDRGSDIAAMIRELETARAILTGKPVAASARARARR